VDAGFGAEAAAEGTMVLGVVALVGEYGTDARHDGEGGQKQPLENERVVDIGGRGHAGDRDAGPVHGDMILGAPLGAIRRVRAGKVAPALGAPEQVSRIRSGWPRSMPTSMAWTCASKPVSAQRLRLRRRVAPLACSVVAIRLRHGVPSRRNRRKAASTRMVAVGGGDRARDDAAAHTRRSPLRGDAKS
jgi:hypothetical protein